MAELLRPSPCRKVQRRVEERLEEVSARMKDLRHVRRVPVAALTMLPLVIREGWEALAEAREGAREGGAEAHDLEG